MVYDVSDPNIVRIVGAGLEVRRIGIKGQSSDMRILEYSAVIWSWVVLPTGFKGSPHDTIQNVRIAPEVTNV